MIEEIHEYAIPLDEDESNHPELDPPGEFIEPNDPRLAEPILELNPEGILTHHPCSKKLSAPAVR
jgi:hypothetical protein